MLDALLIAQVLFEKVAKRATGPMKFAASVVLVVALVVLAGTGSRTAVVCGLGLVLLWILFVSSEPGG